MEHDISVHSTVDDSKFHDEKLTLENIQKSIEEYKALKLKLIEDINHLDVYEWMVESHRTTGVSNFLVEECVDLKKKNPQMIRMFHVIENNELRVIKQKIFDDCISNENVYLDKLQNVYHDYQTSKVEQDCTIYIEKLSLVQKELQIPANVNENIQAKCKMTLQNIQIMNIHSTKMYDGSVIINAITFNKIKTEVLAYRFNLNKNRNKLFKRIE